MFILILMSIKHGGYYDYWIYEEEIEPCSVEEVQPGWLLPLCNTDQINKCLIVPHMIQRIK